MQWTQVTDPWSIETEKAVDEAYRALKRQSLKQMQRRLLWWRLAIALRRTIPWAILVVTLSAIVGIAVLTLDKLNH